MNLNTLTAVMCGVFLAFLGIGYVTDVVTATELLFGIAVSAVFMAVIVVSES